MDRTDRPNTGPKNRREARLHMARLRQLVSRLDHQAALIRNGGHDLQAESRAGKLSDEAFAIRWALRQIAPETECLRQTLSALNQIGGSP